MLLVALEQGTKSADGMQESRGEDRLSRVAPALAVRVAELLEEMMKGLDDVQETLLLRVSLCFCFLARQILMEVMETMTEAWGEPQGVENGIEEAGVSEVGKACHARAAGPRVGSAPAVHVVTGVALTSSANRLVTLNN